MNRKKALLLIVIAAAVVLAVCYSYYTFLRVLVIRWTIGTDLPDWLKVWLWGWK